MSRGVFLRRAGAPDLAALMALERQASAHPWSESQLGDELARQEPDEVLVLAGGGGLVGYCAVRHLVDEAHVMNLAIAPAARRRGLGRFLLGVALARAFRCGACRALLEVREGNAAARALYTESGFTPVGRRRSYYRQPLEDALVLARERGNPP